MNAKGEEEEENDEERGKKRERTKMLAGKISDGKKKTLRRLRWRKRKQRNTSNIVVLAEQNQKDRNVVCVGSIDGVTEEIQRRNPSSSSSPHLPTPLSWSSTSFMSHHPSEHEKKCSGLSTSWKWSKPSSTTLLLDHDQQILFHPRTSSSTQVILADRPLDKTGKHRWEIVVPAVYGTSMMFGIATREQQRTSQNFTNLIGIDQHGWGLSHHGLLWHNGISRAYLSKTIEPLKPCLIALEFDADQRTLSYTIDNQSMGVAFQNIPRDVSIYPAVSSTSAQSTMLLKHRCRTCSSLKDICVKRLRPTALRNSMNHFDLPQHLLRHIHIE